MAVIATAVFTIKDSTDYIVSPTSPVNPSLDLLWLDTSGALATIDIGANTGVTSASVNKEIFETKFHQNGFYTFVYSIGLSSWKYDDLNVTLDSYGISVVGSPGDQDSVTVTYRFVTDIWKRWDGSKWIETIIPQDDLQDAIEKSTQNSTQIIQLSDAIQSKVEMTTFNEQLNQKVGVADQDERISSVINQTAKDIELSFATTKGQIDELTNEFSGYRTVVQSYQRFSENGIELGKSDSPFKALLSNEKQAFQQDAEDVAYISNKRLHVSEAEIGKTIMGNELCGYFDWTSTVLGMGMKWRG